MEIGKKRSAPTAESATERINARRVIKPASQPTIQNIVITANMGDECAMRLIAMQARGQYNTPLFTAAIICLKEPRCTVLVFNSGLVVLTGCKSETDAQLGLKIFRNFIERTLNIQLFLSDITIRNIVCSLHFGYPLDLYSFWRDTQLYTNYEPDLFPGLHHRFVDLKTMNKAFSSGSLINTGSQDMATVALSIARAYKVFPKYKLHYYRSHYETLAMVQKMAEVKGGTSNYFENPLNDKMVSAKVVQRADPNDGPIVFSAFSPFSVPALLPAPPCPDMLENLIQRSNAINSSNNGKLVANYRKSI